MMELTGIPFLVLVVVLTVSAFILGAAWLPRTGRSVRGFVTRLAVQLGVRTRDEITPHRVGVSLGSRL